MIPVFAVFAVIGITVKSPYGYAMGLVTFIYGIVVTILYYRSGPKLTDRLVNYIFEQGQIQKHLLKELSIPYVLTDWEGRVLWANQEFEKLVDKEGKNYKIISQIFPELKRDVFPKGEDRVNVNVEYKAGNYRVELKSIVVDELILLLRKT